MADVERKKKRRREREDGQAQKKRRVDSSEDEEMEEAAPAPVRKVAPKSRLALFKEDPLFPPSRASGPIEHSDLKGSKELWLFQVPAGFDVDSLDGKDLKLERSEGEVAHVTLKDGKKARRFSIHRSESTLHTKLVNVFPSSKDNAHLFGMPFSYQLNLAESIALPSGKAKVELPKEVKKEQLPRLEGRYRPFGGGSAVPKETFAAKSKELGVCTRKELQSVLKGASTEGSDDVTKKKGKKRALDGGAAATPPKKKKKRASVGADGEGKKKKRKSVSGTPEKAKKKKKKAKAE